MRIYPAIFLALAACATSHEAPTRYERGTYRPVRAPTFRPHEDAPHTVGQPGHLQPERVPASPHKRVLPSTSEPGLWSGDVKASAKAPAPSIAVEGETFMLPPAASASDQGNAFLCADAVEHVLDQAGSQLRTMLNSLSGEARRCAVLSTWLQCMGAGIGIGKAPTDSTAIADAVWERHKDVCERYEALLFEYKRGAHKALVDWYSDHLKGPRR